MAGQGRAEGRSRRRARAASVVVPFPRSGAGDRLDLARFVPSGRSLLLAFGLLVGVFAVYWAVRASPLFDVQRVEVLGAPRPIAGEVRASISRTVGRSLLAIDIGEIEDTVRSVPSVAAVRVDRAFPHTLVVHVAAERPVAVVRRGASSWLVTGSGRVIREVALGSEPDLPRLWLTHASAVQVGGMVPAELVPGTEALMALRDFPLPRRVRKVRLVGQELTLLLRGGREVRLGNSADLRLKLAVAARVFPLLAPDAAYLDVSVAERPVAGTSLNSQVEGDSSASISE